MSQKAASGISKLDSELRGGFDAPSTILVCGPPMSAKDIFVEQFFCNGLKKQDSGVFITIDKSAEDVISEMEGMGYSLDEYKSKKSIKLIDSYSLHIGDEKPSDDVFIRVEGPMALSKLCTEIYMANAELSKLGNPVRNVIHSVSSLLLYNNPDTIFRFLQVLLGKVSRSGVVMVITLEKEMHDPHVEATLKHLVNTIVEFDIKNDQNVMRVVGTMTRTDWMPFMVTPSGIVMGL